MVTATASEDLAGFIDKIKQSFADLVSNTKLADFVQGIIGWLSKPENIMNLVNKIKDVFAGIVSAVGAVMGGIMKAINFFGGSIDTNLISMVEDAGGQIKSANLGSLSVGASAAKEKVGGTSGGGTTAVAPSTKMGRSSGVTTTINFNADGKTLQTVVIDSVSQTPQQETSTGKLPTK
jgi:hypothetical protein